MEAVLSFFGINFNNMSHFAKIVGGLVTTVIVAERDFINSLPDAHNWVQTSYNTQAGRHARGGLPLRKNYAGIGYSYSKALDAFIPPRPDYNHDLDPATGQWVKRRHKSLLGQPVQGTYSLALRDENGKALYEIIEEGPNKKDRKKIPAILIGIVLDARK